MRKTLLALAGVATLVVSSSLARLLLVRAMITAPATIPYPRTYPGPGGYPYWSGYVNAPVDEPMPPCCTGVPNASGMGMAGANAACASAADQVAAVSVPRPADSHGGRLWATACQPREALFQFAIPVRPSR